MDSIVSGLSRDPPRHREYRGNGDDREDTPNRSYTIVSFIEVQPLNAHQSTHTYILLAALIFPK